MKHDALTTGRRKAVNLSLDADLVAAAKAVDVNLSRVSEQAIRKATRAEEDRRWQEEHREWIEATNAWVEKNGLPLEKYRMF